jgi:hypothetical protein
MVGKETETVHRLDENIITTYEYIASLLLAYIYFS